MPNLGCFCVRGGAGDRRYPWCAHELPLIPGVFFGELLFTALLAFVVLCVATTRNAPTEYSGFAIGICYIIGGYALAGTSSGILNPALAIGINASNHVYAAPICYV